MAGCLFLETTIITSHDSDFKQVIQTNDLKISFGKEEIPDEEIVIHDLLVLGNQLIQQKICRRSEYRKFIKAILGKNSFDIIDRQLVDEMNER
ncbi:hypothetical protein [Vagococcus hydrophili]|uniref:Uncharacterized protein n=1 Tax=Vagococcus hydrophili TaxID=2714947 RepID=A0A6G8ASZ3_9ENTE|nr:hypothetical protein [Vagococcus hydrophili]QIL48198.1 hypothetical protein G7082_06690 [Vagococcus hydrophili]